MVLFSSDIIFNPILTERTTALTDLLLFFLGVYYCWDLYRSPCQDYSKRKYWSLMFGFTAMAALLGAIAHGFHLSQGLISIIWQPLLLCLGFVIAFFVQGSIHEKWGQTVSDKTFPYIIGTGLLFYLLNVIFPDSFLLFVGYEAIGMLFALGIYFYLFFKLGYASLLLMITGILISIIAAETQANGTFLMTIIWPFDHNSAFHLLQALSSFFIFGFVKSTQNNRTPFSFIGQLDQQDPHDSISDPHLFKDNEKTSEFAYDKTEHLLREFSSSQLDKFYQIGETEMYQKGEKIISEGASAQNLFLIKSGRVEIVKDNISLARLGPQMDFGVMALVDGSDRSADVYAQEDSELIKVNYADLLKPDNNDIFQKIINNQLKSQQRHLRRMNEVTVAEVKEKLDEAMRHEESSNFFISLVFVLVFYQFVLGCFLEWGDTLRDRSYLEFLTPLLTIFLGLVSLGHAFKSRYHYSEYGLNLKNWKYVVFESLLWTSGFITLLIFAKWIAISVPGPYYGKPLLDSSNILDFDFKTLLIIYSLYALLVPVQELVARGVIQSSLMKIFKGEWSTFKAILLSNCMFSAFHLYLDIKFAVLTFIPGIFWGYLFARQNSLLGVSISHILIGLFSLMLIGVY